VENFNAYGDVSDEYSEEDEDEVEMLVPLPKKNANGQPKMRQSVSAEAYGAFNQKGNFSARVIAKSADAEKRILARMEQAFMFSGLDEKETKTVLDSFEEKQFNAGDNVIT
jgi:cAMP-dependent protein kinase regulator